MVGAMFGGLGLDVASETTLHRIRRAIREQYAEEPPSPRPSHATLINHSDSPLIPAHIDSDPDCLYKHSFQESKCQAQIDALYECCRLFYEVKGDDARTVSCPKPDLLRLKLQQRAAAAAAAAAAKAGEGAAGRAREGPGGAAGAGRGGFYLNAVQEGGEEEEEEEEQRERVRQEIGDGAMADAD
ncbi:Cx9C motif-containing protein 4, mitochondrial [Ascosphaera acerosa]|nr:Cx9C motif-containing protein 4, mitochondrial [Ascosphaera acerosa]